jgi:serine/threonine-protein kinase RsbW
VGVIEDCPAIRLELESVPEAPSIVRSALGAFAEELALEPELVDDLKTAVTEACNNVITHAYGGAPGPLELLLYIVPSSMLVVVRDRGPGISGEGASEGREQGVGVPIIQALTRCSAFRQCEDGGTEVWMDFATRVIGVPASAAPDDEWIGRLSGDTLISLSPVSLVSGVLGRVARALAARARFSLDRFSDVYLATDAIAMHAIGAASGGRIGFGVAMGTRHLEITIGPFRSGASAALSAGPGRRARSVLALLADEIEVLTANGKEMLRVVIDDRRLPARASAAV